MDVRTDFTNCVLAAFVIMFPFHPSNPPLSRSLGGA
jgi:hypothetical protein